MQNILSVKEKLETQAKNDFAIAAAIVNEEEEKLKSLIERQEGYRLFLKKLQQGELDFKQIKETTQAIESLKYLIEDQKRVLDRAEKNLEIRRVALAEAMQDVKTHEKLKERQFAEYMAEEAARESKEIDELVSYRFGQAGDQ